MTDARQVLLQRILASKPFASADSLKHILQYLCECAAASPDVQPKEYEIAVQALGRTDSFDPKIDPIVRVSIASIRERLQRYFETEGTAEE